MATNAASRAGRALSEARTRKLSPAERKAVSDKGRAGFYKRFEDLVDPERTLPADVRARRVAEARSDHFREIGRVGASARWSRQVPPGASRTATRKTS